MILEKPIDAQLVKKHIYSILSFDSGFLPHSNKPATRQYPGIFESNSKPNT